MPNVTDIYNFVAIDPSLTTSGQPTGEQFRALSHDGCEVIINLALHDDPQYSLLDEAGVVEALGMKYIHIPVQFDTPNEDNLMAFFHTMDTNKDKKIHVHCAANKRVTAFLGLYQLLKQGKPKEEAFVPMQSVWQPNKVWSSFISEAVAKHGG